MLSILITVMRELTLCIVSENASLSKEVDSRTPHVIHYSGSHVNKYDDSHGVDRAIDQEFDKSASKIRYSSVRAVREDEMESSDK